METLRPFGDVPRDLKVKVTRTFVAARSFIQGLMVSGDVVRKVSQVQLNHECVRAMMKMTYCPHCRGMASARPCANYCSNVMKGCLANQADLNTEWGHLADTMVQVAGRFEGPVGVDTVILSLPARIASAINTMMENMEAINSKSPPGAGDGVARLRLLAPVFQACGTPREGATSTAAQDEVTKGKRITAEDRAEPTWRLQQMWSRVVSALVSKCVSRGDASTGLPAGFRGFNVSRLIPDASPKEITAERREILLCTGGRPEPSLITADWEAKSKSRFDYLLMD
ncbi:hypothetical protein CRUP_016941 [Coryphaenoides rupestris]|nr:hypothetical protein CRUP_016941 [Coryphaenoides rupestris]